MNRRFILMRHGDTLRPDERGERLLSPKGLMDAFNAGEFLKQRQYLPQYIACSPLARTRQTLGEVLKGLNAEPPPITHYEDRLKSFDTADDMAHYMNILTSADDSRNTVMFIGHNGATHTVTNALDEAGATAANLRGRFPMGSLCVFEAYAATWYEFPHNRPKLIKAFVPSSHEVF
jgi:phosphohistidine phosphatase